MHYVYAGFDESLNRRSHDKFGQIYIVKFGYCMELSSWDDRFNDGFKNKETGEKESLPLALCTGWRRIATVEAGNWDRASRGIETSLKFWATEKFGLVELAETLDSEVCAEHLRRMPGAKINKNGLGELRYISENLLSNLGDVKGIHLKNDPLADEFVEILGYYLESELAEFAKSLKLPKAVSKVQPR